MRQFGKSLQVRNLPAVTKLRLHTSIRLLTLPHKTLLDSMYEPFCLPAEFMGTLLFQMFGGSAPAKDTSAPAANGFALVAIIYAFCNISGGHLNPAVSFALMCTGEVWEQHLGSMVLNGIRSYLDRFPELRFVWGLGIHFPPSGHMKWWKALMYMSAQILGAIFGALIYAALIPQLHIGGGNNSPGCFGPAPGVNNAEVFGWETMMTFTLVMTVYASAVAKVCENKPYGHLVQAFNYAFLDICSPAMVTLPRLPSAFLYTPLLSRAALILAPA